MKTQVIKIDANHIDDSAVRKAAAVIDAGGLVAFPTETVYGIACRVSNASLAKLNQLKGRPAEKYYTLHIAESDDVSKYVPTTGLRAKKLIKSAWPGPLTIVFGLDAQDLKLQKAKLQHEIFDNLYRDGSIGLRCPAHPVAAKLLTLATSAVVAPSANLTNQPPAVNAGQVIERFEGQLDIILDADGCKFAKSSTVAKISKAGIEILRQGVLSESQVLEMAQVTILFVCTGNSCRSPMAEGLFKKYLAEKLACPVDALEQKGYIIRSAGTMGMVGFPATGEAINACMAKGVDISAHRSSALTKYLIEQSDLIYVMARVHGEAVVEISPEAAEKCLLLAEDYDIEDPIGRSQLVYDSCADLIDKAVKKIIGELVLWI
ncbi:MAG: L-threonylcarbamoyladenylate synthase [Sedimentisphaerales bacterium]